MVYSKKILITTFLLFVLTSFSVFSQDKISNQNGDLDVSEVVDMKNISEDASSDYFSNIDEAEIIYNELIQTQDLNKSLKLTTKNFLENYKLYN